MVVFPQNEENHLLLCKALYEEAHVPYSPETRVLGWLDDDTKLLKLVVGFNAFLGKTAQIHVCMAEGYHFTPREMLEATFDFAFNNLKLEMLFGIVNSNNKAALKYDLHLGFEEASRFAGMHDDGGDIVVLCMLKEDCKYLQKELALETLQ